MAKIHIGQIIKNVLKKRNLSASDIAELLEVTRRNANKILNKQNIYPEQLTKISEFLNQDIFKFSN